MYKLDPVILAPKVKNNREAHEYYLKHTMEQAAILREVVEQAKSQNPLDKASYSACMYVKMIQELLGYVRDIFPDIHKPSNIPKVTNRPLLSSTGVNPSTSASGSKPSGNIKNDRISRTPTELQRKDTTIKKLKAHNKRVNETSTSESVKKDFDEIETINIELEHRVTKLIAENEHLKQTYKQLYDSITNQSRKSVCHNIIKNDLRKLKGNDIVDNATTIASGMYKLDLVILDPKVKNNREAHGYYLINNGTSSYSREVVKNNAKSQNPLE
ncbi:hypothetical protein Tco_0174012 [Tanacetum coccineum]